MGSTRLPRRNTSSITHLLMSNGFDVPATPDVSCCGMIQPYNETERIHRGQSVFTACNRLRQPSLRGEKVSEAGVCEGFEDMSVVVSGVMFYITFDTKDLAGGTMKTYQAVVGKIF